MKFLISALQLIPVVLAAIRAVEEHVVITGVGKQKLTFIQQVVQAVYEVAGELVKELPNAKALEIVTRIVSAGVDLFNKLGVFQKSGN